MTTRPVAPASSRPDSGDIPLERRIARPGDVTAAAMGATTTIERRHSPSPSVDRRLADSPAWDRELRTALDLELWFG